ncbi:hypothetical protein GCM10011360_36770 [Primorskyibacter flagellatus]|uniref:DUF1468 domain-containing protein n=1 Tax=Primorskyibacter flagellatus TaxID=1387277 RepID=A0A917EIB3_9RHOB|nr:tripartite tricarboxylate transporter TctB family protein [Primorskyibacter flagellatus]GGE46121.1 hypothetical protein GCM10011360_36770 [Primorskyibacter flagellatus]
MSDSRDFSTAKARIVTGVIAFVVGGIYLWQALDLPVGEMGAPGPALFPLFIAALIFIAAVITLADGYAMLSQDETFYLPAGKPLRQCIAVFGALLFLAVTLPFLGRIISPFVTIFIVLASLSGMPWWKQFLWSAGLTLFAWLAFVKLLGVPLPRGILGV